MEEIIKIETISPEIVYQQDKAQIDVQISTAKAYPRNIKRSVDNAIAIVSMDKETAATCSYSIPRAGKTISGPSVHLAKILAQVWGNLRVEAKIVNIDNAQITSQAVAFDLENNLAIKVEVKRSIIGKHGRFKEDMITVTGNAANAISLRNAILSVIPRSIVDKVYKSAKDTITGDLSDKNKLLKKRKQVFDGLKDSYDVSEKEVLDTIGKESIDNITADDLLVIIGIMQAIKDGDTTVKLSFKKHLIKPAGNPKKVSDEKEQIRVEKHIEDAKTLEGLDQVKDLLKTTKLQELYETKKNELVFNGA